MNQKTKKTFIFIIIFIILFLVAIFIFNEINKNNKQNNNNLGEIKDQTSHEETSELEEKELEEDESKENKITEEKKEYLLNLINFNITQLLIMEGYLESDLKLNSGLIINEKEALFKYQHKGRELEIEIDFDYYNNSELMINDYKILNKTTNELIINENE